MGHRQASLPLSAFQEPMDEGGKPQCLAEVPTHAPHNVPLTDGPSMQDFMLPVQGYFVILMASSVLPEESISFTRAS